MGRTENTFRGVKAGGRYGKRWLKTYAPAIIIAVFLFVGGVSSLCFAADQGSAQGTAGDKQMFSVSAAIRPFEQTLILHPYQGLPSEIVFIPRKKVPVAVQGLFVLDGVLLRVPFAYRKATGRFTAVFPTPKKLLRYQFQMMFDGGKTLLSEVFAANPQCSSLEAEEMIRKSNKFRDQQRLLREAVKLDREVDVLKYLVYAVDDILKQEE